MQTHFSKNVRTVFALFAIIANVAIPSNSLAKGISVLMYHDMNKTGIPELAITREQFRKQLEFLDRNRDIYPVVSGEQALESVAAHTFDSENNTPVLITIDDGWKSAKNFGAEMDKFRMKGLLFVVSGQRNSKCCLSDSDWKNLNGTLLISNPTTPRKPFGQESLSPMTSRQPMMRYEKSSGKALYSLRGLTG